MPGRCPDRPSLGNQIEKEREMRQGACARARFGGRIIHDGFRKYDYMCINVSFCSGVRCCGDWGWNYFRENGRNFGLFGGGRWHFRAGLDLTPGRRGAEIAEDGRNHERHAVHDKVEAGATDETRIKKRAKACLASELWVVCLKMGVNSRSGPHRR